MFSKLAFVASLAVLAVATPAPTSPPPSQCDTGPIQCCSSVQSAGSPSIASLLGLLGIVVQDVTVPIGVNCSPISVIGVGGNDCTADPVCCENNDFNGIIAIGCTPINVNL
ncbi:hydrophobin-251 [Phellopilus nigrolimitatus]|nr:hydrophobin-251 [Phellopilus nigrolimitatus]